MQIRTDMAVELAGNAGQIDGIRNESFTDKNGMEVSRIEIVSKRASDILGKPIGNYVTLDMGNIARLLPEKRNILAKSCADEIKNLIGENENVLIVGLGNRMVTPDSLGPKTCDGVFVTRHIKKHIPEAIDERASTVSAIAPGVLGVTGIESEEVINSLAKEIRPDVIVAVDALAAKEIKRIGGSIQISDAGIQPGAGMGNGRNPIDKETTGVKVVAIGVPTVAYASTVARDYFQEASSNVIGKQDAEEISNRFSKISDDLVITPTDIDKLTDHAAQLLADALNIAVNPHIPYEDIRDFMD